MNKSGKTRAEKAEKRVQLGKEKARHRERVVEQLTSNVKLTETIQRAAHLLMLPDCHSRTGGFLEAEDEVASLVALLNDSLLQEVIEERLLGRLCCNVVSCLQPAMSVEEVEARKAHQLLTRGNSVKDLTSRLKARKKQGDPDYVDPEQLLEALFCSDLCQEAYESSVQRQVDEINESSMYLLNGSEGPFVLLKKGAGILERYANCQLATSDKVYHRIERRNVEGLLVEFWKIMKPFADVKIVEKNIDQLATTPVVETISSNSPLVEGQVEAQSQEAKNRVCFDESTLDNGDEEKKAPAPSKEEDPPKARPNFPIVIKRNPVKPTESMSKKHAQAERSEVEAEALSGEIVEVVGTAADEVSVGTEECESEAESEDSGVFGLTDMATELAACEDQMSQFMRLNLLFSQIGTTQFAGCIENKDQEFEQLPSNPARDFFLRNIDFEPFMDDVEPSYKGQVRREMHQLAYLLNIQNLSMRLDRADWAIVSRVMLSLVTDSLDRKVGGPTAQAQNQCIAQLRTNIGTLTDEEDILRRLVLN